MDQTAEIVIRQLRNSQALAKLIGGARAFVDAIDQLGAVAKSDAAVLISGETGTGKELIARAIHYLGDRVAFPFVAVNCGSLTDTLLEDELFGHERGAFTDAQARRPGLIAQADRGTLFLDEVDALTPRGQVALLRVLNDRTFRVLGSSHEDTVDVRFVAATNAPLWRLVQTGQFRPDLYYRLCVFSIDLPPLRERKEDILLLATHFLEKHAPPDRPALELSPAARAALLAFDWPGNVRELENAIIRATQACRTPLIDVQDLRLPFSGTGPGDVSMSSPSAHSFKALKRQTIEAFERGYLIRLMCEHRGNVSHAALSSGKERRDLSKLLKKYRLDPKVFSR